MAAPTQLTRIETLARLTEALEFQDEQLTEQILTELIGEDQALKSIAVMLVAVMKTQGDQTALLNQIEQEINAPPPSTSQANRVEICVTRYSPLKGGSILPGTITLTDDHIAHTPIKWSDDVGSVPAPADAAVVSSDPAVATVAFNADMTDVDTTPLTAGTMTLTVSSASLSISDTVTVNVTLPTASSVSADAAGTTFTPKV